MLHGSAAQGKLKKTSDIDIAVYVEGKIDLDCYQRIYDAIDSVVPGARPDVGILNNAEAIYRVEAITGRLLFNRDIEKYLYFFSRTYREYENQIADYERQEKYRLERTF